MQIWVRPRQAHVEIPDYRDCSSLLRSGCDRPRRSRAAEEGEEGAATNGLARHSITSSARTRNVSGMVSPIAFAVLRLTTSSNLVENWTGKSPGLVPRRMRLT